MTLTLKTLKTPRLKRLGIVTMVAGALLGQSAFAGAQEQRDRPSPTVVTTATPPSSSPAMMLTVGGTLADLFTTLSVLNSNAGREANPILGQSPARIIAVKSALLVPQLIAEHHLATHGHPKAAMWLGVALGGLGTAMAIHNMNVGR
jgi:hypothetical protein